jgi:heme O synthase-like polyprenyltransferase
LKLDEVAPVRPVPLNEIVAPDTAAALEKYTAAALGRTAGVLAEAARNALPWLVRAADLVGPAVPFFAPVFALATNAYAVAAGLCGAFFLWRAAAFLRSAGRDVAARQLFFASIAYLPLVLSALVADRMVNF